MAKKENNDVERKETTLGIKIFISIPDDLDKRIRAARHKIQSDKFNAACVSILRLGVERIEQDENVVEELRKKFVGEDED